MERYSCKQLKSLVASGVAKDVTYADERSEKFLRVILRSGMQQESTVATECY